MGEWILNIALWAFLGCCLGLLAWCLWLWFRNDRVFNERLRVLKLISQASYADIKAGRPWEWRYEAYDQVSHEDMLFSQRPVRSFFEGHPAVQMPPCEPRWITWEESHD